MSPARFLRSLVVVVAVASCGSNSHTTDGGGDLALTPDLAAAAVDMAAIPPDDGSATADMVPPPDLANSAPKICAPSGMCAMGPECGGGCCGSGEHCVMGQVPYCRCGSQPACSGGNHCASPGPQMLDGCGSVCCGAFGAPCPL